MPLLETWFVLSKFTFLFLPSFPFPSLYSGAGKLVSNHLPTLIGEGSLDCRVEKDSEAESLLRARALSPISDVCLGKGSEEGAALIPCVCHSRGKLGNLQAAKDHAEQLLTVNPKLPTTYNEGRRRKCLPMVAPPHPHQTYMSNLELHAAWTVEA